MKPSLFQRQLDAVIVGLVWPFPYIFLNALAIGSIAGHVHGHGHGDNLGSAAAQIGFLFGIPLLVAYYVAWVSGPYDLLSLVTMLIPAAGLSVFETSLFWDGFIDESGMQLSIYLKFIFVPVTALSVFAAAGIALKRVSSRRVQLDEEQSRSYRAYLKWDFGILGAIAVLAFGTCAVHAVYTDPFGVRGLSLGPRERFVLNERQILDSPNAPEQEKIYALYSTEWDKPELGVIRDALKDNSAKVRFFAAVILLEARDGSGLGELEPSLMHSAKVRVFDVDTVRFGQMRDYDASLNLEHITDKNAAPILTRLEQSDDAEVRNAAHLALGRMGLAK